MRQNLKRPKMADFVIYFAGGWWNCTDDLTSKNGLFEPKIA